MIDLALETEVTPEQLEYLGVAKSSADSLLTIINDILDYSKIEAGKLDIDPIDFRLRDTLADAQGPRCGAPEGAGSGARRRFDVPDALGTSADCGRSSSTSSTTR